MAKNEMELYMWPDVIRAEKTTFFEDLEIKIDQKAAIGAGASGLLPELNFLLVVSSLIASGFLTAIGEDTWKVIKKGVKKLANKKPPEDSPSLPPNYSGSLHYELIWWLHFRDMRILITIGLSSEQVVKSALDCLPEAIDEAVKTKSEFSRLVWNGKSWDRF